MSGRYTTSPGDAVARLLKQSPPRLQVGDVVRVPGQFGEAVVEVRGAGDTVKLAGSPRVYQDFVLEFVRRP